MDRHTIISSINRWRDYVRDGAKLVEFFEQGDCFVYELPLHVRGSSYVHVYPGIHEEKLYFFCILSQYDTPDHKYDFENYVHVCPVIFNLKGSHTLPSDVAIHRMYLWTENYKAWIPERAAVPDGVFRAFAVPIQDFQVRKVQCNLALRPNGEQYNPYSADLLVTNVTLTEVYMDDFSKPVPPYSAALIPEDFYLLQL